MAPAEPAETNRVTGSATARTVRTAPLFAAIPGMSPRSPKRNVVVALVYLLVLWILCAHLLTAVSGG